VAIIDISNPRKPRLASVFRGVGGDNDLRDVEVQKGIGYFASDTDGSVYLVDVSNPNAPRQLSRISTALGGAENVHTLSVQGNYLFTASTRTPDIHVFNVRDPRNPRLVRVLTSASEYPVHEVTAMGNRLYTAVIGSPGVVDIFDISNVEVAAPRLQSFETDNIAHTSWPVLNGDYLAVAREEHGGDLEIWDIRNLANPVRVSRLGLPATTTWSVHQVMTVGTQLYASWYQAGVRVFDVSAPAAPRLIAYYDTFPFPDVVGFNGSWGVFPYLGPDRILASDMYTGLYILRRTSSRPDGPIDTLTGPGQPPPAPRPLRPLPRFCYPLRDNTPTLDVAHHLSGVFTGSDPAHPALRFAPHRVAQAALPSHATPTWDSGHGREGERASYDHVLVKGPPWHKPG
jgi:choice-of-anchor B domain-containing protein